MAPDAPRSPQPRPKLSPPKGRPRMPKGGGLTYAALAKALGKGPGSR